MENQLEVTASAFCTIHHINFSFIELLTENDLIKTHIESGIVYIPEEHLASLEKMVRLHYDLQINVEGIETIACLLDKLENAQQQVGLLKQQLAAYESLLR